MRDERRVVFDTATSDVCSDDRGEQFVVGIAAIEDVKTPGLNRARHCGGFGTRRRGQGRIGGNPLEDVEVEMELDPSVPALPESQAIRGKAAKTEPSTAVSPLRASASRPVVSGTAWAASSWTIGRSESASKTRAASESEPRAVRSMPSFLRVFSHPVAC